MSGISTHILDLALGKPAVGVRVTLFHNDVVVSTKTTNSDGRIPEMLATPAGGTYRLVFDIAGYRAESFFPEVSIVFLVADPAAHYHIPLLLSPFGYSTYRGS